MAEPIVDAFGGDSMLDLDFSDVYEPIILSEGTEVHMRIESAEKHESKAGSMSIHVTLEDPSNDHVDFVHYYLVIPDSSTDAKTANKQLSRIRDLYKCFSIDYQNRPVDVERDLPGAVGDVILGEEDDPQYGKKNTVKSLIIPK